MRRSQGKGKETTTQGRRFLKVGKLELGDCKGGKRQAGVRGRHSKGTEDK